MSFNHGASNMLTSLIKIVLEEDSWRRGEARHRTARPQQIEARSTFRGVKTRCHRQACHQRQGSAQEATVPLRII